MTWDLGTGKTIQEKSKFQYSAKCEQNCSYFGITNSATLVAQLNLSC
jgi:hypothetical protein